MSDVLAKSLYLGRALVVLFALAAAVILSSSVNGQSQRFVERAILIYNNFPDSYYRIGIQLEPGPVPEGVIGLPVGVLSAGLTQAEAGALISAVGVYFTPDLRQRKIERFDRAARYDRLLQAFRSCPGALISAAEKVKQVRGGGFMPGLVNLVRTEDVKYVVPPDPDCVSG